MLLVYIIAFSCTENKLFFRNQANQLATQTREEGGLCPVLACWYSDLFPEILASPLRHSSMGFAVRVAPALAVSHFGVWSVVQHSLPAPFPVVGLPLGACAGEGRRGQCIVFASQFPRMKQEVPESRDEVETSRTSPLRALSVCPVPNRQPSA